MLFVSFKVKSVSIITSEKSGQMVKGCQNQQRKSALRSELNKNGQRVW